MSFPGCSDGKESACNAADSQSLDWEDPLEEETATHSSTLAWRIPPTEEPGGLQSTGLERVRHDWAANTAHTSSKGKKLKGEERTQLMGAPVLRASLVILDQRCPHLLRARLVSRTHRGNSGGPLSLVLKNPSLKTHFLYQWTDQNPA